MTLARYYDWLSWFQRVTSWTGSGGGYRSLTVHRGLAADDSSVGAADVIHEQILAAVGPLTTSPRVIDAGCGLGGTIFYLHQRWGGEYHGLTLSETQRTRARREAERRGVARDCQFHLRSYDRPVIDLVPGGADVVIAIESLAHSADPTLTLANWAAAIRPGGRLVVVDDVPVDALADIDGDFAGFRAGWQCQAIARREVILSSLAENGLTLEREVDLTPLVRERSEVALERLVRINRRARRLLAWTGAGQLIDSLHGGLMLERLYRRGVMRYRLVLARRREASG
jgi:SAM-dependent methyltransferase